MTIFDDLEGIRRAIAIANPGWPMQFVKGYVDGILDASDEPGHTHELRAAQKRDIEMSGYRAGLQAYPQRRSTP